MKKLAIFASGNGSNAVNILNYFKDNPGVTIPFVLVNNPRAVVIEKAADFDTRVVVFGREDFDNGTITSLLEKENIDLIILAGFLWKLPPSLINVFPGRILNIHPALLPRFGGKGMYGERVHQAVKDAGEEETGITIHLVDEEYDRGEIIFREKVKISPEKQSVKEIEALVRNLELKSYPLVIEKFLKKS